MATRTLRAHCERLLNRTARQTKSTDRQMDGWVGGLMVQGIEAHTDKGVGVVRLVFGGI
jgi:hypothetical protein